MPKTKIQYSKSEAYPGTHKLITLALTETNSKAEWKLISKLLPYHPEI